MMDPAAVLEQELLARERANTQKHTRREGGGVSRRQKNAHQTFSEETFTFFTTRGDEEEDEEDEEDATPGTTSKRKREKRFGGRGEGRRRRHFFSSYTTVLVGRVANAVKIGVGVKDPASDDEVRCAFKIFLGLFVVAFGILARENARDAHRWLELEKSAEKERFASLRVEGAVKEVEKNMNGFIETSWKEANETTSVVQCPPKRKCPPKPECDEEEEEEQKHRRNRQLLSSGEDGDDGDNDRSSISSKAADDPFLDDLIPKRGKHDFKIFVYDLKPEYNTDLARDQPRCRTDQYGTEIRFHENLMHHAVRTTNPEEAEFFFVPIYGECYLFRETQNSGTNNAMKVTNLWYRDALKTIQTEHPYWNRTDGRDHVWSFPGARGPHIFRDWKKLIKKSIFLTPEGDRSFGEQFNTWKDIVIPGLEPDSEFIEGKLRKQSSLKKDIFAFFRGTILNKAGILAYSRGIRPKMEAAFKKHKDVIFTEEIPSCDRDCYRKELTRSTFCLCPRGWSPWTLRAYQAMMVGCIPVIIADEIELPYENSLDWTKLSVKIAEVNAEKTIDILKRIPKSEIRNKQKAIEKVWKSVAWGNNPKKLDPTDAMECVLHELGRKKRAMKASTQTFWFES